MGKISPFLMLKDLDGAKFFAQATYISHGIEAAATNLANQDAIEALHRAIDGEYNPVPPQNSIDGARTKVTQLFANQFNKILTEIEPGDEESRKEQARLKIAENLSSTMEATLDEVEANARQNLRITAESVHQSIITSTDYVWDIDAEERKQLMKEAKEIMPIDPPIRREQLKLPEKIQQVEDCLTTAQTHANVTLAMCAAVSAQHLNGRIDTDRLEAVLASAAETVSGISASRRANLYGFKANPDGVRFLTEASFDASSRLKSENPIKITPFPAKKFPKPEKTKVKHKMEKEESDVESEDQDEKDKKKRKNRFFSKPFKKTEISAQRPQRKPRS